MRGSELFNVLWDSMRQALDEVGGAPDDAATADGST